MYLCSWLFMSSTQFLSSLLDRWWWCYCLLHLDARALFYWAQLCILPRVHTFLFIMHWGYHQLPFTYSSSPCNRKLGLSDALPLVEFSSVVGGLWFTRFSLNWSVRADMRRKFSRCVWRCSVEPSNLMTQWGSDAQDPVDRGWTHEISFLIWQNHNYTFFLSSLFSTHGGVSGMPSRQTTSSSISRLLLNFKIRQCGMWHYVFVGWLWVASSPLKTVIFLSSVLLEHESIWKWLIYEYALILLIPMHSWQNWQFLDEQKKENGKRRKDEVQSGTKKSKDKKVFYFYFIVYLTSIVCPSIKRGIHCLWLLVWMWHIIVRVILWRVLFFAG